MNAPVPVSLVLRSEKGAPLTSAEVDANFTNLVEALQALATRGAGAGLASVEFDPDTGVVTLLDTGNLVLGTFQLPSRPVRPRDLWTAGVAYVVGDLVRVPASATVPLGLLAYVTREHTSDADGPAEDLATGALLPLVYDGRPAQTMRGTYTDVVTYAPGDVVNNTRTGTYYQLVEAVPAGTKPTDLIVDGPSFRLPWIPVSQPAYRAVRLRADGKPGPGTVLVREMIERGGAFGVAFGPVLEEFVGPAPRVTAKAAASGTTALRVFVNGNQFGTITFSAGSTNASFATLAPAARFVSVGDVLEVLGPTTADGTLSDVYGYLNLMLF
jgi:hypothetical protein